MTDKEQIKAIIKQYADRGERLYNESYNAKEDSQAIGYWDGYRDCANLLLRELDDIQEEPESHKPKITLGEATGKLKELVDNISEEGLVEAHKQLEELTKECMYSKDNYTDEDRKVLCEGCEEECEFNKKEEPVSEDLEKEFDDIYYQFGKVYAQNAGFGGCYKGYKFALKIARHFAEWQKAKDQETIETAIHHAYHNGKLEMKEQMMAKAVDATVHIDAGGYPYIPQMELYDYKKDIPLAKEGDKYKVILIKED